MTKSDSTSFLSYDQIPHAVLNYPGITGDHIFIFIRLYKVLKEKEFCTYSNEKISELTNISPSTIKRKLNDLEKWTIISRKGMRQDRKIFIGNLLINNNKCNLTVIKNSTKYSQNDLIPTSRVNLTQRTTKKSTHRVKLTHAWVKMDHHMGQFDLHNKNLIIRTNNNCNFLISKKATQEQKQSIAHFMKYDMPLTEELMQLIEYQD